MEEYVHQVCQGVKSAFRGARGICIHWFHAGMKLQWATYLYLPYEECRVFLFFFFLSVTLLSFRQLFFSRHNSQFH